MKLNGVSFRGKPSTAITIATWVNLYSLGSPGTTQQIFIAKDSKQRCEFCCLFLFSKNARIRTYDFASQPD